MAKQLSPYLNGKQKRTKEGRRRKLSNVYDVIQASKSFHTLMLSTFKA